MHCPAHPTPHNKLIDANDAEAADDVAAAAAADNDGDKPRANSTQRAGMPVSPGCLHISKQC